MKIVRITPAIGEVEKLQAIHDPGSFQNQFLGTELDPVQMNASLGEAGAAIHSIVKIHPVSRKKLLYVNPAFTRQIVGYSTQDSDRLLGYLYDHMDQPEYQVRHRWSKGDVVIWDNRVTQHYAVADYVPHYQLMHRVTVVDDRRVS